MHISNIHVCTVDLQKNQLSPILKTEGGVTPTIGAPFMQYSASSTAGIFVHKLSKIKIRTIGVPFCQPPTIFNDRIFFFGKPG